MFFVLNILNKHIIISFIYLFLPRVTIIRRNCILLTVILQYEVSKNQYCLKLLFENSNKNMFLKLFFSFVFFYFILFSFSFSCLFVYISTINKKKKVKKKLIIFYLNIVSHSSWPTYDLIRVLEIKKKSSRL